MKKISLLGLLGFFTVFMLQAQSDKSYNSNTANPNASIKARELLDYFYSLSLRQDKKIVSGQCTGFMHAINKFNRDEIDNLFEQTGHYPGMIGIDYCDYGRENDSLNLFKPPDYSSVNPPLIDYWKNGGLVTISIHLSNPQTGFNCTSYKADIPELIKPGGWGNEVYMSWLDIIAEGLNELQDSGLIVLFRPFHERFWWGNLTPHYKDLWIHLFNYFTYEKKLNNLLWVYAPEGARVPHPIEKYPGDDYVDFVGFDLYRDTHIYPLPDSDPSFEIYDFLINRNKPFVFGEVGLHRNKAGNFDTEEILRAIEDYFPKTVAFQAWCGRWSLSSNPNAKSLLDNKLIVNRSDLPFFTK